MSSTLKFLGFVAVLWFLFVLISSFEQPLSDKEEVFSEKHLELVAPSLIEKYFFEHINGHTKVLRNESILADACTLSLQVILHHHSLNPTPETKKLLKDYEHTLTEVSAHVGRLLSLLHMPQNAETRKWIRKNLAQDYHRLSNPSTNHV